jgi:hypothetical protein
MSTTRLRINALSVAKMMVALQQGPCTAADLIEISGLCRVTVRQYLQALHREGGCYVFGWEKNSRGADCRAVYAWGDGRDKPRAVQTCAERSRVSRKRAAHIRTIHATAGAIA